MSPVSSWATQCCSGSSTVPCSCHVVPHAGPVEWAATALWYILAFCYRTSCYILTVQQAVCVSLFPLHDCLRPVATGWCLVPAHLPHPGARQQLADNQRRAQHGRQGNIHQTGG